MDVKRTLQTLFKGQTLTSTDAERVFAYFLSGDAKDVEIAAILSALATRGETVEEITGAVTALRSRAVPIDAPEGVIDCCGTGGDHSGTFNISTAVSFVLAGAGVPVAKHGNRASSSKSGAADVLEALGLNLDAGSVAVRKALWEANIAFLMAPVYNPAIKYVGPVRKALGARTIFNLLGPLLNPAGAKHQLIGVYDKRWCRPMAEALQTLGTKSCWVVHGSDGLDEITTTGLTHVVSLKDGKIEEFDIHPHDIDIGVYKKDDLKGGEAGENAAALTDVLNGKEGAYMDIVVFNAAAALVVAGKAKDLKEGADLAWTSISSGAAKAALEKLVEIYRG